MKKNRKQTIKKALKNIAILKELNRQAFVKAKEDDRDAMVPLMSKILEVRSRFKLPTMATKKPFNNTRGQYSRKQRRTLLKLWRKNTNG